MLDLPSAQASGPFPLYENAQPGGMASGDDGLIVCHQVRDGIQFSGTSWTLFWLIPMGDSAPHYECRFSKTGYEAAILTARELLVFEGQTRETAPTATFVVHGREQQMPVWTRTVTMRRASP